MASNPSPAPSPPLGLPYQWRRGVDVAFVPSPGYRRELPGPTQPRIADAGPAVEPLVRGPRPPVAESPPIGGFDPRLITGPIGAAIDLARRLADVVRDAWEDLNQRNGTPGKEASYSRGAYTGSYNPATRNTFDVRVKGIIYSYAVPGGSLLPLKEQYADIIFLQHYELPIGWSVIIDYYPPTMTVMAGGTSYEIYTNDNATKFLTTRYIRPDGTTAAARERSLYLWSADAEIEVRVTPQVQAGSVPYLPDVPAVPFQPDPAGGNPFIDPADVPALQPADAPRVSPFPVPLPDRPITPATAPSDARPLIEEAPNIGGAARQVTTATGLLPRLAPRLVPRIAPIPALPVPGYLPQLTPQGEPQLAPAPAPQPTATDQRQYGPRTVTGTGVRPDLEGIAEEVGRIEMKLAHLLGTVDAPELPYVFGSGSYVMEPICDFDADGDPLPDRVVSWPAGIGEVAELSNKLDAIAELIQIHKEMRQPICAGAHGPAVAGVPVTVTFEQEEVA